MLHIAFKDIDGSFYLEPFQSLVEGTPSRTSMINNRAVSPETADVAADLLREDYSDSERITNLCDDFYILDVFSAVEDAKSDEAGNSTAIADEDVEADDKVDEIKKELERNWEISSIADGWKKAEEKKSSDFNRQHAVGSMFLYRNPLKDPPSRTVRVKTVSESWAPGYGYARADVVFPDGTNKVVLIQHLCETSPAA